MGALSKLDEFLLNPQVRTCSVAVSGTSRNGNSENRETTGDRSSDDPYPEVGYFSHHSGHHNSPEAENNSLSQPQFRSENTPATIEADQILLALQQFATNSNSANFNNNISRIWKLPKSLTTTMPTFDGKSEKFELFEDLFQTSLKIHN